MKNVRQVKMVKTSYSRYIRLLNVLLFSGLGCFSYLLLALYSDLPKRDDLDFSSLSFMIGVMLVFNAMGFCLILIDSWLKRGVLVLCRFGDIAVADELSVICRIEVDGGCRSVVLYSLVGNTASFTRLVGGDGDCRIDGCE